MLTELGAGYVAKIFFDTITGGATAGFTLTSVVALVVAAGLVRIVAILVGALIDIRHRFSIEVLLRRNLLASTLAKPGARALPGSVGEALNTVRDDVQSVEDLLSWLIDQFSFVPYSAAALAILLSIDAKVTLIVVLPLVLVLLGARAISKRVRRFREASRTATERVTGAIGEAMDGVQAIQLAGAEDHVLAHIEALNRVRLRAEEAGTLLASGLIAGEAVVGILLAVLFLSGVSSITHVLTGADEFPWFASLGGWLSLGAYLALGWLLVRLP
ncbi:MAG: ABC transporter transmembrane domain-containing protein, partial [Candidatus Bipolaricaulota bacterium]|nr:ABC transporter transmembrane domain-containing protein [Candidatus Bipolaricaulota bacterium]